MELASIESVRILVAAVQLIVATIVGFAAVSFYRWQKTTKEKDGYANAIHNYHNINLLVIANQELQDIESENHFVAEGLSRKEVRKMFYYFEQLNSIGSTLEYGSDGLSISKYDGDLYYVSSVKNIVKCIYWDREFVRTHCFPRGYTEDFITFMEAQWKKAELDLIEMGYINKGERTRI